MTARGKEVRNGSGNTGLWMFHTNDIDPICLVHVFWEQLGIFFDFTGEVGNSLDSLRLLAWSAKYGKQVLSPLPCLANSIWPVRVQQFL